MIIKNHAKLVAYERQNIEKKVIGFPSGLWEKPRFFVVIVPLSLPHVDTNRVSGVGVLTLNRYPYSDTLKRPA